MVKEGSEPLKEEHSQNLPMRFATKIAILQQPADTDLTSILSTKIEAIKHRPLHALQLKRLVVRVDGSLILEPQVMSKLT